jgi:hypothetical protein
MSGNVEHPGKLRNGNISNQCNRFTDGASDSTLTQTYQTVTYG